MCPAIATHAKAADFSIKPLRAVRYRGNKAVARDYLGCTRLSDIFSKVGRVRPMLQNGACVSVSCFLRCNGLSPICGGDTADFCDVV